MERENDRGVSSLPGERYYADVPSRAFALLADMFLLSIAIFIAAIVVSVLIGPAVEFNSTADSAGEAVTLDRGVAIVDAVISLVISAAYFAGSWVVLAASPGQRLMGMRLGAEADGRALTRGQALLRWALLGAPFGVAAVLATALSGPADAIVKVATLAWYALLLITTARSPTKQGLHDRVPGTVVAKRATPVDWGRPDSDAG